MAFNDFPEQAKGVQLLQRSLERGRLAHSYLFTGHRLDELEALARMLAKTLNCLQPIKRGGAAIDCCDQCVNCQKIEHANHADVFWVRPESRSRSIKIGQITRRPDSPSRVLLDVVNLKPTESKHKIGIIVAADRMNEQAANAFLKTLEEPPANSILILLTTEPQRMLETILSRCLRVSFAGEGVRPLGAAQMEWLAAFSDLAAAPQKSLLGRYRLMDVLLRKLNEARESIEGALTERSPLKQYKDVEKDLAEKWEEELKAAIEAEYRHQRSDLLLILQRWLHDVWLQALELKAEALLNFPALTGTKQVAQRISPRDAMENLTIMEQLQRWLGTNVQEALALEVGLLKLHL
jgi:DNA polymerase-3 subunit delta'